MMTWMINLVLILLIIMVMMIPVVVINFHPLNLMIVLIINVILMLTLCSQITKMPMYSLMIFISMIGGTMIMFLYFTSFVNNYKMKLNNKEKMFFIVMILSNLAIMMYLIKYGLVIDDMGHFDNHSNIHLIYKYPYNLLTYLCIIYLFYSLTLSMKMCAMKFKPLRKMKD